MPSRPSSSADADVARVRDALRAELADAVGAIAVSRVHAPQLSELLPDVDVDLLPVVWGRTLWSQATGRCVVEQPNGLGIVETDIPDDAVVVTTLGAPQVTGRSHAVPAPPAGVAALRGRLLQLTGVRPATRRLDSARFVLLFPSDPSTIASIRPPAGVTAAALRPGLPEYAGAIRFEVDDEVVESELTAYAAEVANRLGQAEGMT